MNTELSLDHLLTLPTVLSAKISPDQRWVVFDWYRVHENVDVFVAPTDGSSPPFHLTHTPEATIFVSWTPDSQAVLVAEDHDRDERARLFRVDLSRPGEMKPLTEDRPDFFIRGGDLRPDGNLLFYGANYDFEAEEEIEPTWIYRHDVSTGGRTPIARPLKPAWTIPELNLQGTHLLYARKDIHPAGRQYYLVDVEGTSDQEILNFGDEIKVFARWFPDGEHILVISESIDGRHQDHISLGVYNRKTRELKWLIDDPERTIDSAWVTPTGLIIVDEISEANHRPSWISPEDGEEIPFPALDGNLQPLGKNTSGEWLGMYYAATSPVDIVRFEENADSPQDLISLTWVWERTELSSADLTQAEDFRWNSEDGLEIQGWLYRAQPNPERAVIYIHGGPTSHSENRLNSQVQYFVSKGFNVLDVNYRGSTGFGLRFRELIKEDGWGGREQDDIVTGAKALIQKGLAKPGRIGVTGTSYGGYSAWCQITRFPPEVIGASVPICGMTDLVVDYNTTRPDLRPYSEEMIGGSPDEIPGKYHDRSPINFVQQVRGNLMIVQGAQDPNVTPENVREVVERLKEHRIAFDLVVFEDEGHGIIKPRNQKTLYTRLAEFFEEVL